ncbi:efflux RND transporter periplasmic adaptor subunit [Shimia sediminis]|uniref:efflux RND transporter periplasmic adaptor subunit n=1 Tax=Shimia sediminis TaxID=2497945 RepID=UPI000F8C8901|nr:HlyD family efflux transporter periplasmic adaptor subunit [Shimia sediminis]
MRPGLKVLLITLPISALGVAALVYVIANGAPPDRIPLTERATPVRVITAQTTAVAPRVVGFGFARPSRTYEAIAQVGGTIEHINAGLEKGAILPASSVLLRISPADFTLAIAQANANIRAAEARLSEIAVSETNQAEALEIEREVLALRAADLERAETLLRNGTISQTGLDAARTAHLAQRQKMQSLESALALVPTQRAVQTEQIAVYQSALETAKLNLARTELTLPFAARVASVSVETGQFLRSGQTAAVLDGIDAAEVEAQVPIAALKTLLEYSFGSQETVALDSATMTEVLRNLGLSAEVHLRLEDEIIKWPAKVDRISDTIDPKSGTLGVIVRVDTAYSEVEPGKRPPLTKGMFVEVSLQGKPESGIWVPRSAVREGRLLLADAEDRLRATEVETMLVQDGIALISGDVAPGARILFSQPGNVVDGMLLDVTEDRALADWLATEGRLE